MPTEQEGLKPEPNWREQLKSLSGGELESGIRFFQSRLAALPADTNQLPTRQVGTRIDNRDLIDPQRAEQINSLKRDITVQLGLAAQNHNNFANPGLVIDMAKKAIGLGIADEVSLPLEELGENMAVIKELNRQANKSGTDPDFIGGFDEMKKHLKVAEAFGWDKDQNPESFRFKSLKSIRDYILGNEQIVEDWKSRQRTAAVPASETAEKPGVNPLVEEKEREYILINFGKYSEDKYEGRRPQDNEDTCFAKTYPSTGEVVAGVFDGVGGSSRGGDASRKALEVVSTLTDKVIQEGRLLHMGYLAAGILPGAEEAIVELNGGNPNITSTTATLVDIKYEDGMFKGAWASVGDSRAYVYRGRWGKLEQLSKDQSAIAAIVDKDDRPLKGNEEFYYNNRNQIDDLLGMRRNPNHKFTNEGNFYPEVGDLVILVTDGVSDVFDRPELERQIFLAVKAGKSPQEISESLVKAVRDDYNESQRLKHRNKAQVALDRVRRIDKQPNPRAKLDDATAVVIQIY